MTDQHQPATSPEVSVEPLPETSAAPPAPLAGTSVAPSAEVSKEPLAETSTAPSVEAPVEIPAPLPAVPSAEPLAETPAVVSVEIPASLPAEPSAEPLAVASAETLALLPTVPSAETSAERPSAPRPQTPAAPSAEAPAPLPIVPSADTSAVPPADTSAALPPAPPFQGSTATPTQTPPAPPSQTSPVIPPRPEAPPPLVFGVQELSLPPVRKDRRGLRAALRWTAAVVVFAVAGAGTAYGVTQMKRSDVPGLATVSDGRWDYPEITRPPLPAGSPGPFADDNKANAHYADQRALLLPAPKGAKADAALRGTDGWLPAKTFLAQYADPDDRKELGQKLTDDGLRHIAARGWTTPDGTHTRIYLLQFDSAAVADELFSPGLISYDTPVYALDGALTTNYDDAVNEQILADNVTASAYTEDKPAGAEDVRQAYLKAGDTLALIVQSRKGATKKVPFLQTVALESQLLG